MFSIQNWTGNSKKLVSKTKHDGKWPFWLIFAKMANLGMQIELDVFDLLRSVLYTKLTGEFKKTSFEYIT